MATPLPTSLNLAARPVLSRVRLVCLVVLLALEVLALTVRFDTASLAGTRTWWADLLGEAHILPRLAIAMAAATVFFSGARLRADLAEVGAGGPSWPMLPFLLGHLLAFAAFALLTKALLEGDLLGSSAPGAWVLLWGALGLATVGLWGAAALPASRWQPLARRAWRPLLGGVLIGATAWLVGQATARLWQPLSHSTFWLVRGLLGLVVPDCVCEPEGLLIGTRSFQVRIAPECSGCEGIGLIWVFLGVYLWSSRRELRFPAALLLLPLATAVIWLANAVRITALIGIGTWGSPEVALGGFHSQAGWLAFNLVALGVLAVAQRVSFFAARPAAAGENNPTAAYLMPLMVLVATMMLARAFTSGFDWTYPVRVGLAGATLWYCRSSYTDLRWSWSWFAVGLGGAVFVLWLALEPAPSADADRTFSATLAGRPGWGGLWLFFRVAGSVVVVPLAEELAFRAYLTRQLITSNFEDTPPGTFTWPSFLVSSLLFGLLHGRWLAGMLAGAAYALALYRRREVNDAFLAHATTNALLAAFVLASRSWSMWA
jgi:exosortase E/protease (VPEID-CTERM system)